MMVLHEMAVAEGILDIALRGAAENKAGRVAEVGLRLGSLSGVETESLRFCWESLVKGTVAEGAVLSIKRVPVAGECLSCGERAEVKGLSFICPRCGGTLRLTAGRELQVEYLEVE